MWDRITSSFSGFFEGGKWGAYLGMAIGAVIGLLSPAAVPGNEIQAAFMGALTYGVMGASAGAGLGVVKNLIFGSGDAPPETPEPAAAPQPEKVITAAQEIVEPSHGLLSWLGVGDKDKGRGV